MRVPKSRRGFKIGDTVMLDRTAKIVGFYKDVSGGVRLDTRLDGFKSWNVKDLVKVKPEKKA